MCSTLRISSCSCPPLASAAHSFSFSFTISSVVEGLVPDRISDRISDRIYGMWTKPRHPACRILKNLGHIFFFGCFKSNKIITFWLFCSDGFWFINVDPQSSYFPIVFNIFVNIFWKAEGFGCMWVPFEFESFNKLCLVFSLE